MQDQTVSVGTASVQFPAGVSGTGPFTFQWKKNGADMSDGGNISGAKSGVLKIANVQLGDDAFYSVLASSPDGTATSNSAHLIVKELRIVTQPVDQIVNQGSAATFSVVVSSTDPVTYQWRKNFTPVPRRSFPRCK